MIITLTIFLFLCGIAGFILNRNNVILLIVAIELLLLAVHFIYSCFTPNSFFLGVLRHPTVNWPGWRALLRLCGFACKGCRKEGNWLLNLPLLLDITNSYEATTYFANEQQLIIYLILLILVLLGLNLILWMTLNSYYNSIDNTSFLQPAVKDDNITPFRALLRYIAKIALSHPFQGRVPNQGCLYERARKSVWCSINKFSQYLKLLLLVFILAIILLKFSDEIYSNIHNNYNFYLFLIYKSCLDLLSLLGLYFRMVINNFFTLWQCQQSEGQDFLPGLGAQRLYNLPIDLEIESNSFEDTIIDQDTSAVFHLALSSEDSEIEQEIDGRVNASVQQAEESAQSNTSGEESSSNAPNISTEQPTTNNQNPQHPLQEEHSRLPSSTLSQSTSSNNVESNNNAGVDSSLSTQTESSIAAETAQPETTNQSKLTTPKTVTFNPTSTILDFEHSLDEFGRYFDVSDTREIKTKTEDGLGPINKDYTPVSNSENQPVASSSRNTLDVQPVASSSRNTLDIQPVASSSNQTLDDQPVAGVSTSKDLASKIITDMDILGAVDALKSKGFISSNFNLSGFTSSDSNTATDTNFLSETEPSTSTLSNSPSNTTSLPETEPSTISDSPTNYSSLSSVPEANESTNNNSKKRSLPSDLEDSDLAPKRKKTD
jgi:hypothetical protein